MNRLASYRYVGDLSDPSVFNNGATGQRLGKQEYYIWYAQDEWKLSSKATLNYGMRYEYYSPIREDRDLNVQFDILAGKLLPPTHSFYQSSKSNFGPRVGLSYSPTDRTAIRGGFGIFYGPGQTEDLLQPIESDLINTLVTGGAFPIDSNAVRANFINNPNNRQFAPRAYAADYKVPEQVYQYSFSVQQELPGRVAVTAAFVGSQGRRLFLRSIANRIVSVDRATGVVTREFDIPQGPGVAPLRPFAEIDYKTSGGHDSYRALQLSVVRRSSKGLTMNSQYTFGRSYGNSAGSNEATSAGNNARAISEYDYENGYNNFDIRHNFNASLVYALPVGAGQEGQSRFGRKRNSRRMGSRNDRQRPQRTAGKCTDHAPDVVFVDAAGTVFTTAGAGRTAVINTPGGGSSRSQRRPDLVPGVPLYLNNDRASESCGLYGSEARNIWQLPEKRSSRSELPADRPGYEQEVRSYRVSELRISDRSVQHLQLHELCGPARDARPCIRCNGQADNAARPVTGKFNVRSMTSTVERSVGLGTNRQIQFALGMNF